MGLSFLSKKSFSTWSLKNIQKVHEAEQRRDAEIQRQKEIAKKLQEERALEEIKMCQVKAGFLPNSVLDRLDWMYEPTPTKETHPLKQIPDSSMQYRSTANAEPLHPLFASRFACSVSQVKENSISLMMQNEVNIKQEMRIQRHEKDRKEKKKAKKKEKREKKEKDKRKKERSRSERKREKEREYSRSRSASRSRRKKEKKELKDKKQRKEFRKSRVESRSKSRSRSPPSEQFCKLEKNLEALKVTSITSPSLANNQQVVANLEKFESIQVKFDRLEI